jgi:uncharacterized membrane protein
MQGKATIAHHPIHPVLVTFPIGCFSAAVVADIVSFWAGAGFWPTMATWLIGFGIAGALLASFFGFVDYLSAPMTPSAHNLANWHFTLNASVIVIYGIAFGLRIQNPHGPAGYALTAIGVLLLAVSTYLGGELSHRHLVGTSEEDVDQSRRPADQTA